MKWTTIASRWIIKNYTIRLISGDELKEEHELRQKIACMVDEVNHIYGDKFNWARFPIIEYTNNHPLFLCFRDGELVGFMLGSLAPSLFDKDLVILKQVLLYARPGSRAAWGLMKHFIDFGKIHANHVITTIGVETNIKPASLEKLGFTKLETLYRMETRK